MGKFLVLSLTDHEEYILSRIMEIIATEPGFDHIVTSHLCNTLVFPGLELRLKERTAYRNGELISMTRREREHIPPLPCHSRQWASAHPNRDTSVFSLLNTGKIEKCQFFKAKILKLLTMSSLCCTI